MTIEAGDVVRIVEGYYYGKRGQVMRGVINNDEFYVKIDGLEDEYFFRSHQVQVIEHHHNDSAHGAEFLMQRDSDFGYDVVGSQGDKSVLPNHIARKLEADVAGHKGNVNLHLTIDAKDALKAVKGMRHQTEAVMERDAIRQFATGGVVDRKPVTTVEQVAIRQFASGANRNSDFGKLDYEGFLSPLVLEAYAAYMDANRVTNNGTVRESDNWQKGIPLSVYGKSGYRHFHDWTKTLRGIDVAEGELGCTMGLLFNVMGWVFERMKEDPEWFKRELAKYQAYRAAELAARQ